MNTYSDMLKGKLFMKQKQNTSAIPNSKYHKLSTIQNAFFMIIRKMKFETISMSTLCYLGWQICVRHPVSHQKLHLSRRKPILKWSVCPLMNCPENDWAIKEKSRFPVME